MVRGEVDMARHRVPERSALGTIGSGSIIFHGRAGTSVFNLDSSYACV